MTFVEAANADLDRISLCHQSAFPHALSSALGRTYLKQMLSWYIGEDKAFLFFIEEDNICVGYCGAIVVDGSLAHGSASSMIQHSFNSAIQGMLLRPWLFFHIEFIDKYRLVLKNILYRIKRVFENKPVMRKHEPTSPHVGLVVIGVASNFRGKGYGSAILKHFEEVVKKKGYKRMTLTVRTGNHQAIRAYVRNGWIIDVTNTKSTSMYKQLL